MKVTQVALRSTSASEDAGRPALTPELLAATGARYSRSNEGLAAILAKMDPADPDASVDRIFRFVDYGHASIGDMAPVALFIDGVSLFAAYYLWTLCPLAGGQESSTRYIRLDEDGLVEAETLGIPGNQQGGWREQMRAAFAAYRNALGLWEAVAERDPEVARVPKALLDDPSGKAQRAVARMTRNYAFDRARYFLPVAARTNVMLVQSARAWVSVCQHLLSHALPEVRALGNAVKIELSLAAPRLLKHAAPQFSLEKGLAREWTNTQALAAQSSFAHGERPPTPTLDVLPPPGLRENSAFAADLAFHDNRYAYVGETLRRTAVRFGWEAVAFAEIRDLNRHRTGTKYCPLAPVGFYHAADELPAPDDPSYHALGRVGQTATRAARDLLRAGDPTYIYSTLLGTQFPFEHTTTADKFLYEAELRTGAGAHFRYARHLRDALALWYARFPETRGLVLEGSGEPE